MGNQMDTYYSLTSMEAYMRVKQMRMVSTAGAGMLTVMNTAMSAGGRTTGFTVTSESITTVRSSSRAGSRKVNLKVNFKLIMKKLNTGTKTSTLLYKEETGSSRHKDI